jgi:hypothetical protein
MREDERRVCQMCGKMFGTEADLVEHEVTVHPNVSKTEQPAPKREKIA